MEFVCLCVCEHMRTYLCTHVETEEGIGLPLVLSALFPRENTSLNPELITFQPAWQPTSLMGLPAFTYPSAVTIGAHAHAWLFMWMAAGYANIGLPACITRALSSWTIFPSLVLFVLVLMMHHDGLHYDIFIHVLTVFQSGSSQLSSFVFPLPPHSPPFLPGSWPSTVLSILHVLLGLFPGAWGMVYLQGACASSRDCTTGKKKSSPFPHKPLRINHHEQVIYPSVTKCWRAQSQADFTQAVLAAMGLGADLAVRSVYYSCRRPEVGSQHPYWVIHNHL